MIHIELNKKPKTALQKQKEELAKKKQEQDEQTLEAVGEAIATFEGGKGGIIPATMTFISGGSFNPGNSSEAESSTKSTGKSIEYKIPSLQSTDPPHAKPTIDDLEHKITSVDSNKPRQIDSLLEEFKLRQSERDKRKVKSAPGDNGSAGLNFGRDLRESTDPATTNIRIGNISNIVTPELLTTEFSCYGQVLRSKVMVPRAENEEQYAMAMRRATCGFVLFAHREDAEKAKRERDGTLFHGSSINMSWAKAPDPASMARLMRDFSGSMHSPTSKAAQEFLNSKTNEKKSYNTAPSQIGNHPPVGLVPSASFLPPPGFGMPHPHGSFIADLKSKGHDVSFIIPPPFEARFAIDTFAEHVAISGDYVAKNALNDPSNPQYDFLFKLGSPENMYYMWRLQSLKQGDSLFGWDSKPFQIGQTGPYFVPPPMLHPTITGQSPLKNPSKILSNSGQNIPELSVIFDLVPEHIAEQGTMMEQESRTAFEELLRSLTNSKAKIKDVMIFALDHADSAPEIVQVITESLLIPETKLSVKLSRLFLVSDILQNIKMLSLIKDTVRITDYKADVIPTKAFLYNAAFYATLPKIMRALGLKHKSISGRITSQLFKENVNAVIQSWSSRGIFMGSYMNSLTKIFTNPDGAIQTVPESKPLMTLTSHLDKTSLKFIPSSNDVEKAKESPPITKDEKTKDIDGVPLDDIDGVPVEDIDGTPLDDIDGTPLDDIDGVPIEDDSIVAALEAATNGSNPKKRLREGGDEYETEQATKRRPNQDQSV